MRYRMLVREFESSFHVIDSRDVALQAVLPNCESTDWWVRTRCWTDYATVAEVFNDTLGNSTRDGMR
jgi:hypothetical protein